MAAIITTAFPLASGLSAITGRGKRYNLLITGAWATGDKISLFLTAAANNIATLIGAGMITGVVPAFAFTFKKKIYFVGGTALYFSATDNAILFNDVNGSGNSYIEMTNSSGTSEPLKALASYQGKLAVFSQSTIQIWAMDQDPNNNTPVQYLENIGTVAPLSVKSIGDLDVYFLADSGFHSIRPRDASSNARVAGVGAPINTLIQTVLAGLTDTQKASCPGVVEPASNRYWCCINGVIYVFSNHEESGIAAWSTYAPTTRVAIAADGANYPAQPAGALNFVTYTPLVVGQAYYWTPGAHELSLTNGAQTVTEEGFFTATATTAKAFGSATGATVTGTLWHQDSFTPEKFELLNGRIYVRAGDNVYLYGGTDGVTYDESIASFATFWMDAKSPSTRKVSDGIDAAFTAAWLLKFGMDPQSADLAEVYRYTQPTYWQGRIPATLNGQFMKFAGQTTGVTAATFDAFTILFNPGDTA